LLQIFEKKENADQPKRSPHNGERDNLSQAHRGKRLGSKRAATARRKEATEPTVSTAAADEAADFQNTTSWTLGGKGMVEGQR